MTYIVLIVGANVCIAGGNWLAEGEKTWQTLLILLLESLFATLSVIGYDGASAYLIRRLPEALFAAGRPAFHVSKKEQQLYRRLHIKEWKDHVPELGVFTGFSKSELKSRTDSRYLARFLLESNYGMVIHWTNAFGGIVILLLPMRRSITLPVACVNWVLSLLPMMILRFHTPMLEALFQKAQRAEQRAVLTEAPVGQH